jgi:polyisoprenoid-binding protein YceI
MRFSAFFMPVTAAWIALVLLAGAAGAAVPDSEAPAGAYTLDKTHASLIFRVNHLGFSNYTARFTRLEATLQFDPANPEKMSVTATVDPTSLETDFPLAEPNFDAELTGPNWLDAGKFPAIVFTSSKVEMVGARTANVQGTLTLHGVTLPITLLTTFNGGYAGHPMDPGGARIGFSAKAIIERSKFGIAYGIPAPGTTMGVSDAVEAILEVEFVNNKPKQK